MNMKFFLTVPFFLVIASCASPVVTSQGEKLYFNVEAAVEKDVVQNYTAITHKKSDRVNGSEYVEQSDPNFQLSYVRVGDGINIDTGSDVFGLYRVASLGLPRSGEGAGANMELYVSQGWVSVNDCYNDASGVGRSFSKETQMVEITLASNRAGQNTIVNFSDGSQEVPFGPIAEDETKAQKTAYGIYAEAFTDAGLFMLTKSAAIRYITQYNQKITCLDFVPRAVASFDTENATLDLIYVGNGMEYHHYTAIPSNKLICADLTKNYWHVRKKQGQAFMANLLLAAIQSYTATSSTTYSGTARTSYNGHYANRNFSAYGTSNFSAYSRTYDYSYIGDRAATALTIALAGSASIDQIKSGMSDHNCIIP